jgi:hypothetical protein
MTLFKEPVALEACPAKTAESVSYGATFAVLGWLLISNYSSLGYNQQEPQSITANSVTNLAISAPTLETSQPLAVATTSPLATDVAADPSLIEVSLPAWHADLAQLHYPDTHPQHRAFSTAAWRSQEVAENQQLDVVIEGLGLALPPPLIENTYLFSGLEGADINVLAEAEPMGEITVRGSEVERLTSRPDNIQRPQLPRPYRAQQIQRSLVLPPRIQALRP